LHKLKNKIETKKETRERERERDTTRRGREGIEQNFTTFTFRTHRRQKIGAGRSTAKPQQEGKTRRS